MDFLHPFPADGHRHQVRIREIPVVVGLFLAAHGVGHTARIVPEPRFLDDLAAALKDILLALDLVFQGALDIPE